MRDSKAVANQLAVLNRLFVDVNDLNYRLSQVEPNSEENIKLSKERDGKWTIFKSVLSKLQSLC